MEKDVLIGRYPFSIMMSQVDETGRCRLPSIGNLLIHSASLHARELGFGVRKMSEYNFAWVFTNFSVEMYRMPLFLEEIRIETWVERISHGILTRNFIIYDGLERKIGGATSYWAVMDITKRCIADYSLLKVADNINPKPSLIGRPKRFKASKGDFVAERVVKYSDIDINKHMYSIRYLEHAIDSLSRDNMISQPLMSFDASFHKEVVFDDTYEVYRKTLEDRNVFSFYRSDGIVASVISVK